MSISLCLVISEYFFQELVICVCLCVSVWIHLWLWVIPPFLILYIYKCLLLLPKASYILCSCALTCYHSDFSLQPLPMCLQNFRDKKDIVLCCPASVGAFEKEPVIYRRISRTFQGWTTYLYWLYLCWCLLISVAILCLQVEKYFVL